MKIELLNTANEEVLVRYCASNDPAAQKMLYNKYVEPMMIVCLRYVVNQEEAKEVLMDSFFNCFKHIGTFSYRGEGSLKAWLKKIVVNQCLMHLRKNRLFIVSNKEVEHFEVADNVENALDAMSAKEILGWVQELPDGYRTVFNLYVFEGKSHKEIAVLLNINENTSKSQFHRAKALLKERILQVC